MSPQGHGGWAAVEVVGRFGEVDVTERIGGVWHPGQKLWITGEAGTAHQPVFLPSNTWEADVAGLVARRASVGAGYRHWNYPVRSEERRVGKECRSRLWAEYERKDKRTVG